MELEKHLCPVCGYKGLSEPAYGKSNEPSFEICPSCGTEFGLDDAELSHQQLGNSWYQRGAKWHSTVTRPPNDWNGKKQYENFKQTKQS